MADDGFFSGLFGDSSSSDVPEPASGDIVQVEFQDVIGELQVQRQEAQEQTEEEKEKEDTEDHSVPYQRANIVRPSDQSILEATFQRLQNEGAKEIKREDVGVVENPGEQIDNPQILMDDFQNVLMSLHDGLKERLQMEKQDVDEGFRHLGDEDIQDGENFAYLITVHDKGIIVGGASNIIDNICEHLDLTDVEREFIRLAYDESIRQSDGLEDIVSHLVLDDVVVVFDPDEI